MIKKTYTTPKAEAITFYTESLMTTASLIQSDETVGGASALSNERGGWSSDNWSNVDNED